MKILPYGSKSKTCKGVYIGTIMYGDHVTNAAIYVVKDNVETLLSGKVCEELQIIKFLDNQRVNHLQMEEEEEETIHQKSLREKFPELFKGIGLLKNHQVKFHVDPTVKPIVQSQRPIPFHLRSKFNKAIDELVTQDLVEEHSGPSPWVCNPVLTPKDDGSLRATLDMRGSNTAIIENKTPITRPEEIRAEMFPYKIFSKLDFRSAFHQLELDEESRLLTVFYAGNKLLKFKRLVMGATPATGELANALRPLTCNLKNVHILQDDIIVGGRNQEDHDKALWKLCEVIQESGMTLNLKKCIISKRQIPWWGMIITDQGIKPDPAKIKALKHITPPKDKDELKSLLCMIQSHKDFIPRLSQKTSHMRKLIKKHARFIWDNKCQAEFEKLKHELKEETLLRHFDPSKKSFMFVDAHITGISAILCQGENIEDALPVAYASRATTDVESRYPQLDLESLAIDFALRRYRLYIAGGPTSTVITDHKPLEAIFRNNRSGSIRTERIKMRHQDVKFNVIWRDGKSNPADYLSRHAIPVKHISKEGGK